MINNFNHDQRKQAEQSVWIVFIGILLLLIAIGLTSCSPTKKYTRKCDKAAQKVEKAAQKCPSLVRVDTAELIKYIEVPVIEKEIEFHVFDVTNCDSCIASATFKDSVAEVNINFNKGKITGNTRITPPPVRDTCVTVCQSIQSANAALARALQGCKAERANDAGKVAACEAVIKEVRKSGRIGSIIWFFIGLALGGLLGQRWLRKLIRLPF
jgi:hypothetical protein